MENWGLRQEITLATSKSYKVTFTAKQLTGEGEMYSGLGFTSVPFFNQVITSSFVTYTYYQSPTNVTAPYDTVYFGGKLATGAEVENTFEIKDVSVQEVGQDWILGPGWSIGDDKAICTANGGFDVLNQLSVLNSGSSYKVTYTADLSLITSGSLKLNIFSNSVSERTVLDGTNTVYLTANGASFQVNEGGAVGTATITNISVKEVTRDNIARIDYTDGSSPHLLSEPQRENLITYSEPTTDEGAAANITYESFSWNIGFENCVAFGDNSVIRYRYGGSVTDGTEYTLSAYVLMDDNSEPVITNSSVSGDFSLNIGNTVATGTNNANVSMGNNIWRVSKTAVVAQTTTNNGIIKYTTQSSTGFKVVGWQLEAGSYATSYIPTSGSAVTRNKDQFTRDGIGGLINDSEGVLFVEMAALSNDLTYRILSLSDGTDNERIYIQYTDTTNQVSVVVKVGGSTQANIQHTLTDETVFSKMAFKWKANDFAFWIDGVEVGADTSGSVPSGLNRLALDRQLNTNTFYGKVKQLQVYPTALSDSELTILTTP